MMEYSDFAYIKYLVSLEYELEYLDGIIDAVEKRKAELVEDAKPHPTPKWDKVKKDMAKSIQNAQRKMSGLKEEENG